MTSSPSPFMTNYRDIGSTLSPKYLVVDLQTESPYAPVERLILLRI